MTAEGALIKVLLNDISVQELVGDRIHPASDPQAAGYPKITVQRIGTNRTVSGGGFTNDGPTGKAIARVQLDCWAADLLTAKAVAGAVRRVLNGYVGTIADMNICCVYIDDERDQPGTLYAGQEKPTQRVILDAKMTFTDN